MKKLVLAAMLCTGLAQLTGCIISSDDDGGTPPPPPPPPPPDPSAFSVTWTLLSGSGDADDPEVEVDCGSATDSIVVVSDPDPNVEGDEITDTFNCVDGSGETDPLDPGVYDVWVELRDQSGATLLAQSDILGGVELGAEEVVPLEFDFSVDHGRFGIRWEILDQGQAVSCTDVGGNGISVLSTLVGDANTSFDDVLECDTLSSGSTGLIPLGEYTLVVSLVETGPEPGAGDDVVIEDSDPVQGALDFGNQFEDLGTFVFELQP